MGVRKSSPATLAALKRHAFKPGNDPNRNAKGPVCKERATWAIEFNNALAKRADAEALVEKLVSLAERGVEWAMKEVLDRLLGKVTQPIDIKPNIWRIEEAEEGKAEKM
jgi:hypothetical protein